MPMQRCSSQIITQNLLKVLSTYTTAEVATMSLSIELPSLPYNYNALEPHISERTMRFHHDKHHLAYVNNVKKCLTDSGMEGKNIIEIIRCARQENNQCLFDNAGQVWNHNFYWECMKPGGGGHPSNPVSDMINSSFGSYDSFREQFFNAGLSTFGSGWVWLVFDRNDRQLKIMQTKNGDTPVVDDRFVPILTMDVWEHAYYLDFQNERGSYQNAFLDHLINWDFVNSQLPSK